jgi:ADP-ribose pyrophosphatase YjhB (NUDIX family)
MCEGWDVGLGWDESYLGQLRALAGERTLIAMGACGVLRDQDGRVLLIRRSDNGRWAFPSGTMELGETVRDCAIREVLEETGLRAEAVTPFGLYSDPAHHPEPNMYGFTYQYITLACRVDSWSGELQRVTDETIDAMFVAPGELPPSVSAKSRKLLADLAEFEATGAFSLE